MLLSDTLCPVVTLAVDLQRHSPHQALASFPNAIYHRSHGGFPYARYGQDCMPGLVCAGGSPVLQDSICNLPGAPLIYRFAFQNRRWWSHLQCHQLQRQCRAGNASLSCKC